MTARELLDSIVDQVGELRKTALDYLRDCQEAYLLALDSAKGDDQLAANTRQLIRAREAVRSYNYVFDILDEMDEEIEVSGND